jgi:ankyrin repeat protein
VKIALGVAAVVSAVCLVLSLEAASSSRLSDAIQSGDKEAVRTLLKDPAAVKAVDGDGTTPLHWAVRADDLETSQLLVKAGASATAANRYGVTPLSLAAMNGNAKIVSLLLASGADANTTVSNGQTVLMIAARTGSVDAVRALVDKGAKVEARESQLGETALMWAAAESQAGVVKLLIEHGADVNARSSTITFPKDRFGLEGVLTILPHGNWTPLLYAGRDGGVTAVPVLVKAGAEVNATDPDGTTPLMLAIMNAHYDTANALLENGADPNIVDKAGTAALYAAVDMSSLGEVYGLPPRKVKDTLSATDLMSRLIAKGAVVDAKLKTPSLQRNHTPGEPLLGAGTTPLMRAARNGDYEAVKILLDAGADPTIKQPRGTNALMMSCGVGRGLGVFAKDVGTEADLRRAAELLIDKGVDVNLANDDGLTGVHIAAQAGLDSVVALLAQHGAKLDVKDKRGRTPVDMAMGVGGRGRAGGPPPVYQRTADLIKKLAGESNSTPAR